MNSLDRVKMLLADLALRWFPADTHPERRQRAADWRGAAEVWRYMGNEERATQCEAQARKWEAQ